MVNKLKVADMGLRVRKGDITFKFFLLFC
jgi:hypothetical protein